MTDKKNIDITLATAPPWGMHNPPVGLAYLSTYLRVHEINTEVFDFNILLYRRLDPKWHKLWLPEFKNHWSNEITFNELLVEFKEHIDWAVEQLLLVGSPIIGFSVVDPKERMTIEIIQRIMRKEKQKQIILGGPAVSTKEQRKIFDDNLGNDIDYYVLGEGEEVLFDIVRGSKSRGHVYSMQEKSSSPKIVSKNIADISALPYPMYDEFDFSLYDGGSMIVEWSRGCISCCAFCKGRDLLGQFRMKKAEYIAREIEYHYYRHEVNYFVVCDNLLNGNIAELEKVCDLLIDMNLPIQWEGQAIPYKRMNRDLLKKMKDAGCCKLQWGLESGSDVVLMNIGKGKIFTVADAEKVIQSSHEVGIETQLFIIVGLPGENDEEILKTAEFIKKNHSYIDKLKSINTLHLVHGTELFDRAADYGLCLPEKDWHYKWYEKNGDNDYEKRVERTERLLALAESLEIPVQEHNLFEGKT